MRVFITSLVILIAQANIAAANELEELYQNSWKFDQIPENQWVLESANAYVIEDKYPQAPVHLLVISKEIIPTMLHAQQNLLGEMLTLAQKTAAKYGIDESGFRTVINIHPQGGQTVYQLHIHVIGGRQMDWPPG